MNRLSKSIGILAAGIALVAVLVVGVPNLVVCAVGGSLISTEQEALESDADCILVLGASVLPNGEPSAILRDRLDVGVELYEQGVAPKILVSGDNGDDSYNEVAAMKAYLVAQGIPSEDVFCDHCGFKTYDSMWRAHNIFGVERVVVVTQTYHEYRALYNAQGVGMQAWGVTSDLHTYDDQGYYDLREVFARIKDFGQVLTGAEATSGETVSLEQSGDVTG